MALAETLNGIDEELDRGQGSLDTWMIAMADKLGYSKYVDHQAVVQVVQQGIWQEEIDPRTENNSVLVSKLAEKVKSGRPSIYISAITNVGLPY